MMSIAEQRPAVPDDIESSAAKLVYVAIAVTETATVATLQQRLDLSTLTLLPILSALASDGFIQRQQGSYVCQ